MASRQVVNQWDPESGALGTPSWAGAGCWGGRGLLPCQLARKGDFWVCRVTFSGGPAGGRRAGTQRGVGLPLGAAQVATHVLFPWAPRRYPVPLRAVAAVAACQVDSGCLAFAEKSTGCHGNRWS